MQLIRRDDTSLALALIVGTVLLFHQPLRFALDIAGDIQQRYGVDLVQALVVLSVGFAFHQYRKRQEARVQALRSAAEARHARLRSEDLERLVGIGRALASVTDFTGLSQTLVRYLPKFVGERSTWVLVCQQGYWDVLLRDSEDRRPADQLEATATEVLRRLHADGADSGMVEDLVAFPLSGAAQPVGVVFVHNRMPLNADERRSLEAVAALTAITIRNIQTLVETRDRSVRDPLTGCFNRAHALSAGTAELRRARRYDRPLSLLMLDIDTFKQVNDTYGHLVGDQLLAEIGRRLDDVFRMTDIKCRYGGDEFLIILPDTPAIGAHQVAESLRRVLSTIAVRVGEGAEVAPTVSVGVATLLTDDRDLVSLIGRADHALYEAKQRGRNCVAVDRNAAGTALRLVAAQ